MIPTKDVIQWHINQLLKHHEQIDKMLNKWPVIENAAADSPELYAQNVRDALEFVLKSFHHARENMEKLNKPTVVPQ